MNKDLDDPENGRGSLKGFYSYKNTFDKDSVWLDIPKHGRHHSTARVTGVLAEVGRTGPMD